MKKYIPLILAIVISKISLAVLIQHDADPQDHRKFAEKHFQAVGRLIVAHESGESHCTATLINPRTAITAAHCLAGLRFDQLINEKNDRLPVYFTLDEGELSKSRRNYVTNAVVPRSCVVVEKRLNGQEDFFGVAAKCRDDIALINLAQPIFLPEYPAILAPSDAHYFIGKQAYFAGFGETGNGISMSYHGTGYRIAASFYVDKILHGKSKLISTIFRWGSSDQLLGASGSGDSGGPVTVFVDGTMVIIGTISSTTGIDHNFVQQGWEQPLSDLFAKRGVNFSDLLNLPFDHTKEKNFIGYGTRRYFSFAGDYGDFLRKAQNYHVIHSQPNWVDGWQSLWSDRQLWNRFDSISEHVLLDDQGGYRNFYDVTLNAAVALDVDVNIDVLRFTRSGHITVPRGRSLFAFVMYPQHGRLILNGSLETTDFVLRYPSTLSGNGIIRMHRPEQWDVAANSSSTKGRLHNESGLISLPLLPTKNSAEGAQELFVDGSVRLGALAVTKLMVDFDGTSSILHAADHIVIQGGHVHVDFVSHSNSEIKIDQLIDQTLITGDLMIAHRWTLLKSDKRIKGKIGRVTMSVPASKSGYRFFLLYKKDSIDLVACHPSPVFEKQ